MLYRDVVKEIAFLSPTITTIRLLVVRPVGVLGTGDANTGDNGIRRTNPHSNLTFVTGSHAVNVELFLRCGRHGRGRGRGVVRDRARRAVVALRASPRGNCKRVGHT